jgi:Fanconi anemia group M protein
MKKDKFHDIQYLIIYDSREPSEFVDKLRNLLPDFEFKQETLEVGDYICNGLLIERKSPADFLQSITDGRLNDQLIWMSINCPISALVVVGDLDGFIQTTRDPVLNDRIVRSAIAGIMVRRSNDGEDGITSYCEFRDETHFADFLFRMSKKDPVRRPKLKKLKISKEERLVRTVATVDGWGTKLARAGLELFGTIERMMQATPKQLEDIEGIGEKKAQDFYEHFRTDYHTTEGIIQKRLEVPIDVE